MTGLFDFKKPVVSEILRVLIKNNSVVYFSLPTTASKLIVL